MVVIGGRFLAPPTVRLQNDQGSSHPTKHNCASQVGGPAPDLAPPPRAHAGLHLHPVPGKVPVHGRLAPLLPRRRAADGLPVRRRCASLLGGEGRAFVCMMAHPSLLLLCTRRLHCWQDWALQVASWGKLREHKASRTCTCMFSRSFSRWTGSLIDDFSINPIMNES